MDKRCVFMCELSTSNCQIKSIFPAHFEDIKKSRSRKCKRFSLSTLSRVGVLMRRENNLSIPHFVCH